MSSIEQPNNGNQDINIPTNLPMILKQFCKAAIRTQPYDLLKWSSAYFRALADGEEPPTKLRLEYPPLYTSSGLTLGFLKVLLRQLGDYNKFVSVETICRRWDCLCLNRKDLNMITMIGQFRHKCQVKKFLAIAVGLMTSSLFETMIMVCELFTHEPDGGSAMIPVTLFMEIYGYLAGLRCHGSERKYSEDEITITNESKVPSKIIQKSIESRASLASQDTEADMNSELDSIPKDESDIVLKNETKVINKDSNLAENIQEKEEKMLNVEVQKTEETKSANVETNHKLELIKESSKNEQTFRKSSISSVDDQKKISFRESESDSDQTKNSSKSVKYYPNIPGIGPRLLAEEVANVAVWMTECARRQQGMVGPRNLRHLQCPPLDRQAPE